MELREVSAYTLRGSKTTWTCYLSIQLVSKLTLREINHLQIAHPANIRIKQNRRVTPFIFPHCLASSLVYLKQKEDEEKRGEYSTRRNWHRQPQLHFRFTSSPSALRGECNLNEKSILLDGNIFYSPLNAKSSEPCPANCASFSHGNYILGTLLGNHATRIYILTKLITVALKLAILILIWRIIA